MTELNLCTPINIGCADTINNIAFDGCAYYCTMACRPEIVALNRCHNVTQTFCTCREYDCICYDWCDHCFWASSKSCYNKLFKLDCNMNEVDCITICGLNFCSVITGLSYKCYHDTLLVSFACAIVEVEKHSESAKLLYWYQTGWVLGLLSLCPGTLTIVQRDNRCYVEIFDACYNPIKCYGVDDKTTLKNLIFNPCDCALMLPKIDVFFLKKHVYPCMCSHPVCFEDLGFVPDCCNYKICNNCCCDHPCRPQDACTDVVESVALIETALSHILNAEGEKLQKALAETDDLDKILCVNREINKTIVSATHLEHVLYAKLSALTDCGFCCTPCDKKHDRDDDHCHHNSTCAHIFDGATFSE